ncbi:hypothetical protein HELRODRAFT_114508 [Helobdella robusta]|uniref:Serpin domain-containing protein n=1 Tax=Helobdella robusta TaxID=6412 RepID=T1EG22_HELRO|nr:hypothetical protein HELRODRAFT_114508 [Helobdella robusta]ESN95908.1 hypothetical protein HELRODRAFT_114508 [Helobdella robusta]
MAELNQISSLNAEFALDLYGKLAATHPDANLFYSPISISFALAMTYLGASGKTEEELKSALRFDRVNEKNLHPLFKELRNNLLDTKGVYKLHMANKLYGEKSYNFLQDFLQQCNSFYGAELEPVDFNNPDECALKINEWVEEQTNQKIKNLIAPGILNPLTRLILINAIYFKGDWNEKFNIKDTKEEDFFISKTNKVKVPMMHFHKKKLRYSFYEELNCQVLELPYVGKSLSFIVILPDLNKTSLSDVEKKLNGDELFNVSQHLYSREVQLWLPRFKLETSFEANDVLKQLGIIDLFSDSRADLSKIDGTKELYVSKVIHKAFVEVNEEGSEAAAATGVVFELRCAVIPMEPEVVRVDHPFIFFIKDNHSGAVLFIGKFMKP